MSNFYLSASVVVPMLVYMLLGAGIRKVGLFTKENFRAVNQLMFKIFIPIALFKDIYRADMSAVLKPDLVAFCMISILAALGIVWFLVDHRISGTADQATMTQGIFRSNFILFGSIIAAALCDDAGVALAAAMSAFTVPEFNLLSVCIFEWKRGGKFHLGKLLKGIFSNPLVDAGLLGIASHLIGLHIPELLMNSLVKLGNVASPMALVSLGGLLSFQSMARHRNKLAAAALGRLVLIPLAVLGIAILLGYRGAPLVVILAVFGSPTAVVSGPMAEAMGGNGALAGEIVAITSACSILTIFLFVYGLSAGGLI